MDAAGDNLIYSIFPVLGTGTGPTCSRPRSRKALSTGHRHRRPAQRTRDLHAARPRRSSGRHRTTDRRTGTVAHGRWYGGSKVAVNHLIERSRGRISFVGPGDKYVYGIERRRGYTGALTAAELVDDRWARLAEPTRKGGYEAAAALRGSRRDLRRNRHNGAGVFDALTSAASASPKISLSSDSMAFPLPSDRASSHNGRAAGRGRRSGRGRSTGGRGREPKLVVLPTQLQLGESCGVAAR